MNFREYTNKEFKEILESIIILIDTREQVNSHIKLYLKKNNVKYIDYKLDFGDYSFMVPKNEKLYILDDIYFDKEISLERKGNAEELSGNICEKTDRFKNEFIRANGKMRLLIEDSTYKDISNHNYKTKFPSKSYIGKLHSISESYNCPFFFVDKSNSGEYIYNTFKYYLKNYLKHKINY